METPRLLGQLRDRFPSVSSVRMRGGYLHVSCDARDAVSIILESRTVHGYVFLQLVSAVDWIEQGEFQITWILENPDQSALLLVSARYPRDGCSVPSLSGIWPAAVQFERELHEMYGIDFPGSPRLGEELILEDWDDIPPMRREFDTLEYSLRKFGERPGREGRDPRSFIGERVGEWRDPLE